jgi:hypothetical protein
MYVFCVGMYRACSTWQYEIVSHLVERYKGGRRLGFLTADQFQNHESSSPAGAEWQVLKSHDAHAEFARALGDSRALAVYAYRDLRDVAFSLMHKFAATFDDIVRERLLERCLENDTLWMSQPNLVCQRYEEIVADPVRAVTELATHLQIPLSAGEAEQLAADYSFEANQERANALRDRLKAEGVDLSGRDNALRFDPHTLLHWNHLRENRNGGWREQASPQQRKRLATIVGDWLSARGYERDRLWTEPVEKVMQHLESTRTQLDQAQDELRAQVFNLESLRAEMGRVCESKTQLIDQEKKLAAELEATRGRVAQLESLGATTLQMAHRWRQFANRHPRGCAWLKPVVGRLIRLMAS